MRRREFAPTDKELKRTLRRIAGFLTSRLCDDLLAQADDPRSRQGRGYKSCVPLLKAVVLGIASGCKGLKAVEKMTEKMFGRVRKLVGIPGVTADTTLRDLLVKFDPRELCKLIYAAGFDAWDRDYFTRLEGFPFHAISSDADYPTVRDIGKSKTKGYKKSPYLQVHHDKEGGLSHGELRITNSVLVTAHGRPVVGAVPVLGHTNEQKTFKQVLGDLVRVYGKRFKLLMYDAGAASKENAGLVRKVGKHYLFHIANEVWVMHQMMVQLLEGRSPQASSTVHISKTERVERELTMMSVTETPKSLTMWPSVRTIFRVVSRHYRPDQPVVTEVRYFATSMEASELPADKWEELIRRKWGVETFHQILDHKDTFSEDTRVWIPMDARGALAVGLLRRLTAAILNLHKVRLAESGEKPDMTWPDLLDDVRRVLEWGGGDEIFPTPRPHKYRVPEALA